MIHSINIARPLLTPCCHIWEERFTIFAIFTFYILILVLFLCFDVRVSCTRLFYISYWPTFHVSSWNFLLQLNIYRWLFLKFENKSWFKPNFKTNNKHPASWFNGICCKVMIESGKANCWHCTLYCTERIKTMYFTTYTCFPSSYMGTLLLQYLDLCVVELAVVCAIQETLL